MVNVCAGSVSVMLTMQAEHVTALWTPPPVWPVTNRSVTVGAPVSAACVDVPTQIFMVPPVKSAQRAPEFDFQLLSFFMNANELLA